MSYAYSMHVLYQLLLGMQEKKIKKGLLLPVYACHIRTKLIINNPQLNLQNLMQTVKEILQGGTRGECCYEALDGSL